MIIIEKKGRKGIERRVNSQAICMCRTLARQLADGVKISRQWTMEAVSTFEARYC